jgi:hypothetical protein
VLGAATRLEARGHRGRSRHDRCGCSRRWKSSWRRRRRRLRSRGRCSTNDLALSSTLQPLQVGRGGVEQGREADACNSVRMTLDASSNAPQELTYD